MLAYGEALVGIQNSQQWSSFCPTTSAIVDGELLQARMHMHCLPNSDMVKCICLWILTCQEYAAAFFILADSLKDAVNVCLRNLNDLQLAVGITRAYEGDDGPILRYIIEEHVLPRAVSTGDRWLASWAFWMTGDRGKSVQALIVMPFFSLCTEISSCLWMI